MNLSTCASCHCSLSSSPREGEAGGARLQARAAQPALLAVLGALRTPSPPQLAPFQLFLAFQYLKIRSHHCFSPLCFLGPFQEMHGFDWFVFFLVSEFGTDIDLQNQLELLCFGGFKNLVDDYDKIS